MRLMSTAAIETVTTFPATRRFQTAFRIEMGSRQNPLQTLLKSTSSRRSICSCTSTLSRGCCKMVQLDLIFILCRNKVDEPHGALFFMLLADAFVRCKFLWNENFAYRQGPSISMILPSWAIYKWLKIFL